MLEIADTVINWREYVTLEEAYEKIGRAIFGDAWEEDTLRLTNEEKHREYGFYVTYETAERIIKEKTKKGFLEYAGELIDLSPYYGFGYHDSSKLYDMLGLDIVEDSEAELFHQTQEVMLNALWTGELKYTTQADDGHCYRIPNNIWVNAKINPWQTQPNIISFSNSTITATENNHTYVLQVRIDPKSLEKLTATLHKEQKSDPAIKLKAGRKEQYPWESIYIPRLKELARNPSYRSKADVVRAFESELSASNRPDTSAIRKKMTAYKIINDQWDK